jgi:predicted NBD/HSP70 family sugar kinase
VNALKNTGEALAAALQSVSLLLEPEAIVVAGPLSRAAPYLDGVRRGLGRLGESGEEALGKLRCGEIRAARAAAILALLERIYSPALDFEALCASFQPASDVRVGVTQ